jgi:predicted DNA-binding WGR domain protein
MRLKEPAGARYWEGRIEGTSLVTTSGTEGGPARTTRKSFADAPSAAEALEKKRLERLREGYVYAAPGPVTDWGLALRLNVSRVYTGFLSLDYDAARERIAAARPHQKESQQECELLLYDVRTGAVQRTLTLRAFDLQQVRLDAPRERIIVRADGRVFQINLDTEARQRLAAQRMPIFFEFHLSEAGDRLLAGDEGRLVVLQVEDGTVLLEVAVEERGGHQANQVAALSPSGRLAALARNPGEVELYDVDTGSRRTLTGGFPYARQLKIHPSERYLALTEHYERRGLWVLDLGTGEDLSQRFHHPHLLDFDRPARPARPECFDFDFSADGSLLAVRHRDRILLLDFETGEKRAEIRQPHCAGTAGSGAFHLTFARTNDTLAVRTDVGVISLHRR